MVCESMRVGKGGGRASGDGLAGEGGQGLARKRSRGFF